MKKLLTLGLSLSLVGSSALVVVSCSTGPSKDVEIWLLQESAGASSKITQAYKVMVDDYNAQAKDNGLPEVNFTWKAAGAIEKQMQSNKEKLPDLYVSYPDAVSYYKVASTTKDLVRDMKETLGDSYKTTVEDAVLNQTYIDEGTISGDVNVLPYFKSLDFATINLNLFREISAIILDGKVNYDDQNSVGGHLTELINAYNKQRAGNTYSRSEKTNTNLSNIRIFGQLDSSGNFIEPSGKQIAEMQNAFGDQAARDALETTLKSLSIATEELNSSIERIKKIVTKHETILPFVKALNAGINYGDALKKEGLATVSFTTDSEGKLTYKKLSKVNNQNYAIGIDSLTNKYFMDHAVASDSNVVETNGTGTDFIYTVNADVNTGIADITLNSKAAGVEDTNRFLDQLKDIAISNGEDSYNSSDQLEQWNGTFMSGQMDQASKTYVSEYFGSGTMLYSSGSTAGMWAYQSGSSLSRWDMLATSAINEDGDQGYFLSQGPGIAGFKSQGSNAAEKEQTVKAFLEYIYKADVQAVNSIKSGYLPSTKDGLSIFEKYHSEKFNNITGKWSDLNGNSIDLANATYATEVERLQKQYNFTFEKIPNASTNDLMVGKWLSIDLLNEYFGFNSATGAIDGTNSNLNLVIGTPNILGKSLRESFDSTIKKGTNTLMNIKDTKDLNFDAMFGKSDNQNYQLGKWMRAKTSDVIKTINIIHKDN